MIDYLIKIKKPGILIQLLKLRKVWIDLSEVIISAFQDDVQNVLGDIEEETIIILPLGY